MVYGEHMSVVSQNFQTMGYIIFLIIIAIMTVGA